MADTWMYILIFLYLWDICTCISKVSQIPDLKCMLKITSKRVRTTSSEGLLFILVDIMFGWLVLIGL